MKPMQDWLSQAAARRPDHPYLLAGETVVRFGELEDRVRRAVGYLQDVGVGTVAVWATNRPEVVTALFAVPRAGCRMVILDPRLNPGEAAQRLAGSGAELVVATGPVPELGAPTVTVDEMVGPAVPPRPVDPGAVHTVVFTSGTTGKPKGVRLTWGNLEASAAASAAHLGHRPDDSWLAVLPICHVGGLQILVRSAREATTVVLEPAFDAHRTASLLRRVTLVSLVPTMLRRILDLDPGPYPELRAVLLGGGPIDRELVVEAARAGIPLLPTYGMSETASQIATARLEDALSVEKRLVPLPGAEIRIGPDRVIEVRGPMVSPGYLGEPARPPGEWFRTGDVGVITSHGGLRVLGRADEVIVTGGENVHPEEVEAVLAPHPRVEEVAVVGVPDPEWGWAVAAVYVGSATPDELSRYARRRLAGYKVPKRWVRVETLPRLSMGKIDRRALRRLAEASSPPRP